MNTSKTSSSTNARHETTYELYKLHSTRETSHHFTKMHQNSHHVDQSRITNPDHSPCHLPPTNPPATANTKTTSKHRKNQCHRSLGTKPSATTDRPGESPLHQQVPCTSAPPPWNATTPKLTLTGSRVSLRRVAGQRPIPCRGWRCGGDGNATAVGMGNEGTTAPRCASVDAGQYWCAILLHYAMAMAIATTVKP